MSLLASAIGLMLAASAGAAHAENSAQEQEADIAVLDAVTVTARRVDEKLQEVPASVVVVKPDQAMNGAMDASTEAAKQTVNLALTDSGPGRRVAFIRGIGLMGLPISPFDGTVSFALNGQSISGDAGFSQSLDIERVEVLRGPQNILFGRSSQGGTINIVPKMASWERDFHWSGEYGKHGQYLSDLVMGGRLSENAAGRLAVRFSGSDGDVKNASSGNMLGRNRLGAARGSLVFVLDDRTTLTAAGYYERDRGHRSTYMLRDGPYENWFEQDPSETREMGIGSLELEHQADQFNLTATLGIQDIKLDESMSSIEGNLYSRLLGMPTAAFMGMAATDYTAGATRERAYSGELRLTSLEGAPLRWVTGANFYTSDADRYRLQRSSLTPTGNGISDGTMDLTTYSIFGELGIALTDRLTLTPGVRIGHDRMGIKDHFDSLGTPGMVPQFDQRSSWSDSWVTGGVGIDYRFADALLLYGSIKRGHASGGFPSNNTDAWMGTASQPYAASTSWTYEIGGKTTLMDGAWDISASAFFNDVSKGHLQAFDLATYLTSVVPLDYESYGFEIDTRARLGHGLSLRGGLGYTHARLKHVPQNSPSGAANGYPVPGVPTWTANWGLEHAMHTNLFGADGELVSALDFQYVDSRSADIAHGFDLKSYSLLNARIGWQGKGYSIYVYGRNLLDKRTEMTGTDLSGVHAVTIGAGRTFGIGGSLAF